MPRAPIVNSQTPQKHTADPPRPYLGTSPSSSAPQSSGQSWFTDSTAAAGVGFSYWNGQEGKQFTILETVGGGAILVDFDLDGDLDLFFPSGGSISAPTVSSGPVTVAGRRFGLFRNDGHARFADVSSLIAKSAESPTSQFPGVTGLLPPFYSHGGFVSDYDRDGDPDILVTGFQGLSLLRNEGGKGFVDVMATSGLPTSQWSTAAAWADVNRDGWPDLFLVSYLEWDGRPDPNCGDAKRKIRDACPPDNYPPARQRLLLNQRNGSFTEVQQAFAGDAKGRGLGVVAADLNADGWIDFYVACDGTPNLLYWGGPEFPLQEAGELSATAGNEYGLAEGSMGVDAGDYDGDNLADLWVVNFELEDNSLYHNDGNGLFTHATVRAGLAGVCRPEVKFGTGFADFDLDGWQDLFIINGHVLYETGQSAYLQAPVLLHNASARKGRRFRDVTGERGGSWFQGRYAGRGAAVGDLDNDGDLDLVVVRQNEPVSVLLNNVQPSHWLRLDLRGTTSDPAAVGAVVSYRYQDRILTRHVRSGAGYLSQFDQRILLPVDEPAAKDTPANQPPDLQVTVKWLTGKTERFGNLQDQQTNVLVEGEGESP